MSLFGARIPYDVRLLSKAVVKIDGHVLEKVLQLVSGYLEGKKVSLDESVLGITSDEDKDYIAAVAAGLLTIFKAILRLPESKLKAELIKEELEELKVPTGVIDQIRNVVFSESYRKMNSAVVAHYPQLPRLKEFTWRMDISISTSSLSRVFVPTVIVKMTLTDGSVRTFEMSMKLFHQLRCNVAIILKEMEDIEGRNALKILD